ncbi:heavy-metal-associated domain-containing protein [Roseateles sp. BYS180W]|uniref:Heavy-metal-associated domain-containing protein n=1 Tax=Roseateles rivi TaxID=3299028 RepID=A0ABW7FWU4_9BURK
MTHQFTLPDLSCGHCAASVREAVAALDAQAQVSVDLASKTVQIDSTVPPAQMQAALTEAGFPPAVST